MFVRSSALTSELSTCTPRLTRNLKHISGLNLQIFGPLQAFGLKGTSYGPFAVTSKRGYARLSSAGSCRWACTTARPYVIDNTLANKEP